jgi:hypothetical protein
MIIQHLNWLAVVVSAIAYFALGAIWFNPKVFGTIWAKAHGIGEITEADKKGMPRLMVVTFMLCFIGAIVTGYFIIAVNSWTWMKGAKIGLLAGGGFAGVSLAMNYLYTRKPISIIVIDSLYHVIGFIVCGIITSVWR